VDHPQLRDQALARSPAAAQAGPHRGGLPGFPQPDWRLGRRAGAAIASFAAYSGWAWARYGNAHPERRPDPLPDRFLPGPDVDEYHQHTIRAPAPVTFAVAKQHDLQASPLLWGMFWLREGVPALLRGRLYRREGPRSFLDWLLAAGWECWPNIPAGRS
jgi:hypothetical protein